MEFRLLYALIGFIVGFIISAPIHIWLGKILVNARAWEKREQTSAADEWQRALALAKSLAEHVRTAIADVRSDADRIVAEAKAETARARADLETAKSPTAEPEPPAADAVPASTQA